MTTPPTSELHRIARLYAENGLAVFPLIPGTKKPDSAHGNLDATTDRATIDRWWTDNPDRNIGAVPASIDCTVVDLDVKGGKDGVAEFAKLSRLDAGTDAPQTRTVRTPSGGLHLWYTGAVERDGRPSALGPGIDIKCHGYVVMPPSVLHGDGGPGTTGDYVWTDKREREILPNWLPGELAKKAPRQREPIFEAEVEPDLPVNVERARKRLADLVASGRVAVEGEGGDHRTFAVAAEMRDLGVSEEMAFELMEDVWNPACVPPWSSENLEQKIDNAYRYASNSFGCSALSGQSAADEFGAVASTYAPHADGQKGSASEKRRFRLIFPSEMKTLPEPDYLVDGLIPEEGTVLIYGAPASLKTFVVLDLLASVAAGLPAFGQLSTKQGATVLCAGEAPYAVAQRRWPAFALARGLERPDEVPFAIVSAVPLVSDPSQIGTLIGEIRAADIQPRIIALDTVARAAGGLDENDARSAGLILATAERLRDEFRCAVVLVHHSGKDEGKGARGSSALAAGADAIFQVKRAKDTLAVTLHCEKMKDADEPSDLFLRGRDVGRSLAFTVVDRAEFNAATFANPPLAPSAVGKALKIAGAEHGVSLRTRELAELLVDEAADEKAISNMERRLNRGSKEGLAAFVLDSSVGRGKVTKWTIPDLAAAA